MNFTKRFSVNTVLAFMFGIFIVSRIIILFTSIESVSWKEGLSIGTAAREIIRGTSCPWKYLQLDYYSGESLVLSAAVIPFFLLMGQNLIALKIPTFLFSLATFVTSVLFVKRHFGSRSSVWAAFFLIFCPPIVISHSLLVQAGHSEALLFSMGILWTFYNYLFANTRKIISLLSFGFLSGLGCWFFYGTGVTFLTCLIVWLAVRPRSFFTKDILWVFLAFSIGLIPWYVSNIVYSFQGLRFLGIFLFYDAPSSFPLILKRFLRLLLFALPQSFSFLAREHLLRLQAAYTHFFLCLSVIVFFLAAKIRKPVLINPFFQKVLFFLIYPVIFLAIFAVSGMDIPEVYHYAITFRYFTPLYFFGFMLLGIAVGTVQIPKFFLYPLIGLSLIAPSPLYFNEPPGQGLRYKGYSYTQLGVDWILHIDLSKDLYPQISKFASYFEPRDAKVFFWSLLQQTRWEYNVRLGLPDDFETIPPEYRSLLALEYPVFEYMNVRENWFVNLVKQVDRFPLEQHPYFYKGILTFFEGLWFSEFADNSEFLDELPPIYRKWSAWGLGKLVGGTLPPGEETLKMKKLLAKLNAEEMKWYYRGIGSAALSDSYSSIYIYSDYSNEIRRIKKMVPVEYFEDFYWGVGWKLREKFWPDRQRTSDWINRMPELFQKEAEKGREMFDRWYDSESELLDF